MPAFTSVGALVLVANITQSPAHFANSSYSCVLGYLLDNVLRRVLPDFIITKIFLIREITCINNHSYVKFIIIQITINFVIVLAGRCSYDEQKIAHLYDYLVLMP